MNESIYKKEILSLKQENEILREELSELKKNQVDLKTYPEISTRLFESLTEFLFQCDVTGKIFFASPGILTVLGFSQDEVAGKSIFDVIINPDEAVSLRSIFENGKKIKTAKISLEFRAIKRDGTNIFLEQTGYPLVDPDGNLSGYIGVARDITERKKAERELQESEERFRHLYEASFGGIIIHDKGIILEANEGLSFMTGYSREQLNGMNARDLFDYSFHTTLNEKILSGGGEAYEADGIRKDGTSYRLLVRGRQIPYHGRVVRVAELRDITERSGYEAILREKNKEFTRVNEDLQGALEELMVVQHELVSSEIKNRNIINGANEIIGVVKQGIILFVNASTDRILGYSPEEMINKNMANYIYPEDLNISKDYHEARIKGNITPDQYEIRMVRKNDQVIWVRVNASTFLWENESVSLVFISDITETKKTQTHLEQTRALLEAVILQSSLGIVIINVPGKFLYLANDAHFELLGSEKWKNGTSINEIIANKDWKELDSEDRIIMWEDLPIVRATKGEFTRNREIVLERRDGSRKILLVSATPVYDAKGDHIAAITTEMDITERKQMEVYLQTMNTFLGTVIQEAPFAMLIAAREDENWKVALSNREAEKINGSPFHMKSLTKDNYKTVIMTPERKILNLDEMFITEAIRGGKSIRDQELIVRGSDDKEIWINASCSPIRDDQGNILGAVATFPDITHMKQIEELLRQQNHELMAANEELVSVNEEIETINEELVHSQIELEKSQENYRKLAQELEERVGKRTEELMESMENLKRAQDHLVQSEKMASLGGLVAGVAHEINTPLGVSVTAASFLHDKTIELVQKYTGGSLLKTDLESFLSVAEESSSAVLLNLERAADLIQSFKLVSVDQSNEKMRTFNMKKYVDEVLLSLHSQYKRTGHSIRVSCPDNLELNSYPGVFFQIISNLVMNSLQHGFDGIEAGIITMDFVHQDQKLIFTYSDNGRGMNEYNLKRVFDPFHTTRRGKGGTGLGMHIVYNLVTRKLDGNIDCYSEEDQGTRFIIALPVNETNKNA